MEHSKTLRQCSQQISLVVTDDSAGIKTKFPKHYQTKSLARIADMILSEYTLMSCTLSLIQASTAYDFCRTLETWEALRGKNPESISATA